METRLIKNGLMLGLILSNLSNLGCNKMVKWLKYAELLALRENMKEEGQLLLLVKLNLNVSAFPPNVLALTVAGLDNYASVPEPYLSRKVSDLRGDSSSVI